MRPEKLNSLLEMYKQKVQDQSNHHFLPKWRREFLYLDLAELLLERQSLYGWLAVLTAEKVLPFFFAEMPHEKAPERLIKLAKRLCRGSLPADSQRVAVYSDYAYNLAGTYWSDWEVHEPSKGYYAGFAAYKALWEARGWRFLANWYKNNPSSKEVDNDFASSPFSDTAGVASCAYADNDEQRLEFWQWWFDTAIPQAWELSKSE